MYSYTNKNKISSVKGEKHDFQTVAGGPPGIRVYHFRFLKKRPFRQRQNWGNSARLFFSLANKRRPTEWLKIIPMDLTDLDGTTVAGNDELLVPFNPKDVHRVVVAAS